MLAADQNHPDNVAYLIESGADINAINNQGQPILDISNNLYQSEKNMGADNSETLKLLLEYGARAGNKALDDEISRHQSNIEILQKMLPDTLDENGNIMPKSMSRKERQYILEQFSRTVESSTGKNIDMIISQYVGFTDVVRSILKVIDSNRDLFDKGEITLAALTEQYALTPAISTPSTLVPTSKLFDKEVKNIAENSAYLNLEASSIPSKSPQQPQAQKQAGKMEAEVNYL